MWKPQVGRCRGRSLPHPCCTPSQAPAPSPSHVCIKGVAIQAGSVLALWGSGREVGHPDSIRSLPVVTISLPCRLLIFFSLHTCSTLHTPAPPPVHSLGPPPITPAFHRFHPSLSLLTPWPCHLFPQLTINSQPKAFSQPQLSSLSL